MYVYVDGILKVVDFSLEISCCICQTQRRRVFAERKGASKSPESTTSPQRTGNPKKRINDMEPVEKSE